MNIGININNIRNVDFIKDYNIIEINSNEKEGYALGSEISNVANECISKKVDLYIDNSFINCMSVANEGITTLRIGNKDDKCNIKEWKLFENYIKEFDNWDDINKYIDNSKLIKFMEFSDEYSEKINKFLRNNSITNENINFYEKYIKTGGNFWFVTDLKTDEVIATVGLIKSVNNEIVENLFIDKNYEGLNIGESLKSIVDNFVKYNIK